MTQEHHLRAMARCEALDKARWSRATSLAMRAGLDAARNVWGNAMIGRDHGAPWRGVDYALLREAIRIDDSRGDIYRLRTRLTLAWLAQRWPESYQREVQP